MKNELRIFACCLLFTASSLAQVSLPAQSQSVDLGKNVYGLGLSAGMASGFGVSFRHHLPSIVSYQIVGGIIKVDTMLLYDVGTQVEFDLARGPLARFYVGGGLGYFYSGGTEGNDLSAPFRAGLGVGGEWGNFEPFHLSADIMLTYFSDGTVIPLPQIGAHYYFF